MLRAVILLAATTCLPLVAQAPTPHLQSIADGWTGFVDRHGPNWSADWCPATATPKAITGPGLRVATGRVDDLATASRLARAVLTEHAGLLGLGNSAFVEDVAAPLERVHVFVYRQRFRDLEVIGGRADVRLHRTGVVSMFGSQAVAVPPDFDVRPSIDAGRARATAWQHLGQIAPALLFDEPGPANPADSAPQLVIHADVAALAPATPRLAWKVRVDSRRAASPTAALTVRDVYVGADDGTVLAEIDLVHRCAFGHDHIDGEPGPAHGASGPSATSHSATGGHLGRLLARRASSRANAPTTGVAPTALSGTVTAWLNRGASPLDALMELPLRGIRVDAGAVGSAFTDASGAFSIPYSGTAPVTLTVALGSGDVRHVAGGISPQQGTPARASVQAMPGVPMQIVLGQSSDNALQWSQPTVAWFVDDAREWIEGLVGPGAQLTQLSNIAATVNIAQECNAFYTQNTINFYAAGGSCNMSGYSSVIYHEWGHGLDDRFGGISQVDGLSEGWGDILATYRMDDPVVGRDFTTTGGFVRTALNNTTYPNGGFPPGGAPHPKGECFMGWAWDVRARLIASLGRATGVARAESIVVASIVANATNQPDAVREVFLLDDDDGNLTNGTPNYADLSAASRTRNLPHPQLILTDVTHTALGSTERVLTPRPVFALISPRQGTVNGVSVVYRVGTTPGRRRMQPTGIPNQFVALLPGVAAPETISYWFDIDHSSGLPQRFPLTDEIEFGVGRQEQVLMEHFDSPGPNGWASTGSNDEWQRAAPRGLSGSSLGVNWRDPASAVSSPNVYGTDLGMPGNGAYEWFSDQTLVSPALDFTGRTNVRLRFQRWLTLGPLDSAAIRANGTQAWGGTGVADTGWSMQEVALPGAANRANVRIEFNLRSLLPFNLGGWNLDDVEVTSLSGVPNPPVEFRVTPAQIGLGATATVDLRGAPQAPVAIILGTNAGPLNVPGIGDLEVGGSLSSLVGSFDANGALRFSFRAPSAPALRGSLSFAHALQYAGGQVELSNPMVMLLGD